MTLIMNSLFAFLKQIRIINLLMLVLVQFITNKVFVQTVSNFHLILLSLATVFIAAGGYIINDIYDYEIDKINKASLVKKPSQKFYFGLSALGLIIGLYLSYISNFNLFLFFAFAFFSLLIYANYLSSYKIFGNILISLLIVEAVIIIPFFSYYFHSDALPISYPLIIQYATFAFFLNWIREIIKDLEDQKGDLAFGRKTLPILIGEFNTKIAVVCLIVTTTILLSKSYFADSKILLIPICLSLLLMILATVIARDNKDFKLLSLFLKIVMLYGLLSPLFS